ncbi:competence protein ComEC [Polaribacter sp. KT25b]|uniref:ComEC/Rec2 family competence protein n=1 Tax=Polaribacter sp. KT25b TaxID=1855336 RepID=UPI00087B22D4|nr:ComEC/Rec2 family competence protein [Polaribacter sp. KT25b]SDS31276.1 competence protein ComEC [Polaribacter sp. KT25b]
MKRLLNYLPFHFVGLLILGIYLQFYHQIWQFGFLKLFASILVTSLFLLILKNKKIVTVVSFILFFFIGVSAIYFTNDVNYNSYYQHSLKDNSSVVLKVDKVLKSSTYYDKYEVEVTQVDGIKSNGKVLLNVIKDSLNTALKVDELLVVKSSFQEINSSLNPHQFNYKNYLERQGIHQQLFLENKQLKRIGFQGFSLLGISAKFRNIIEESLQKYNFKTDELAVINALILGQRQDISKELISDYQKAGAIHILAVSGLHVGIILLILSWIFKPLERLKNGKIIKTILVVLFLWMFAFVAGLSASVVRAVTMFTFLSVSLTFKRKNVIEFSLISSMFLLLVVKPMFLFDVGFQLSYLAVFGIIWVQPKLYKMYKPRFKIVDKFWQLITVSFAAQMGILPLSLFYFHQFPSLFLLSNLVIIPFLGAILIGGIVIISLSLLGFLPQILATIYGFVISLMNNFVGWISMQEQFLWKEISMSFLWMITFYFLVIFGTRFLIDTSAKKLIYFLISIVLIQSVFVFENHQKKTKKEFIVFHKSRNSVIGIRVGEQLLIHHDLDTLAIEKSNFITSYSIGENINKVFKNTIPAVFQFKKEQILIIDSLGVYQLKGLINPIVVLQYSPKINLERLIKTISPKQIIADGNNYKTYVNNWKAICEKQKTPFYYTGKNGAFVYEKK